MNRVRPVYRCYCCGEELGDMIALVSYAPDVDRVFIMKPEHVDRIETGTIVQLVARAEDGTR